MLASGLGHRLMSPWQASPRAEFRMAA